MAYVEWHDTVRNHYKTDDLMLTLSINRREAVGIIGCLSSWAIQFRPGGLIERNLIPVAVEWEGDPEKLVNALLKAGWLDKKGQKVAIHDWKEITRGYRKARRDAARRKRDTSATGALEESGDPAATAPLQPRSDPIRSEQNGTEQIGEESTPPVLRHLSFFKIPGYKAKRDAMEELNRLGVSEDSIIAKAKTVEAQQMDFYEFVKWCRGKKNGIKDELDAWVKDQEKKTHGV